MIRYATLILIMLLGTWSSAALAYPIHYRPFKQFDGYREIQIAPDLYFVAFYGVATNDLAEVESAWTMRAAEICSTGGYPYFIELLYSFEPVLRGDPTSLSSNSMSGARAMRTSQMGLFQGLYENMLQNAIKNPPPMNWPYKQAHVRCVKDASATVDSKRLIDAAKIVQEGRARGWIGQTEK